MKNRKLCHTSIIGLALCVLFLTAQAQTNAVTAGEFVVEPPTIHNLGIFQNVRPPDPSQPHKVYEIGDMDFRLKPNSKAVDAGCRLPNMNDDFTGRAPDLGALELGKPQPVYGPRQ